MNFAEFKQKRVVNTCEPWFAMGNVPQKLGESSFDTTTIIQNLCQLSNATAFFTFLDPKTILTTS